MSSICFVDEAGISYCHSRLRYLILGCDGCISKRAHLGLEKEVKGSISINEFCRLIDMAVIKHGKGITISAQDKQGRCHLSSNGKHLGYIDLIRGSLIWD